MFFARPAVPSMINDVSPAGLDAYIEAKMKVAHVPGLAACVVHDGEVVWAKGFGWANITRRRRVTPDTGFMLASISKTFIATAVMQQVAREASPYKAGVPTYLVAPSDIAFGMSRMYQLAGGKTRSALKVVRSREEALADLGVRNAVFEPVTELAEAQ